MTKSQISSCVIFLALAAFVPFGAADFEVSADFTAYSNRYESTMLSRVNEFAKKIEFQVNSVGDKISQVDYLKTVMNVPIIGEAVSCVTRKLDFAQKHVIEFGQILIKLISYLPALGIEIHKCLVNASRPGAVKAPACIMEVTGKVAQASIKHQQRLVLDAIRIFATANGLTNTIKRCVLYNN